MNLPSFSEKQVEATAIICAAMAISFELLNIRILYFGFGFTAVAITIWAFLSQTNKLNWKPKLKLKEGKTKVNAIIKLLVVVLVVSLAGFAFAMVTQEYFMPQGAIVVNPPPAIEATLVGTPWTNETDVEWGNITKGATYSFENFTVTNVSAENITVAWINIDLPAEWTETWTPNATELQPTETATGPLTLYVSDNATLGSTEWTSKLTVT